MINVDFIINYYSIIDIFLKFRINCKIEQIVFLFFDVTSNGLFQGRNAKNKIIQKPG